jgi:hypothetical protein
MLDDVSESPADLLTTPFEDWCSQEAFHPEAPGAWEQYARHVGAQATLAS